MIRISNKEIISSVAGNIYRMHPYHMPEGIDKIIEKLVKTLDETPDCYGHVKQSFKLFEFNDFKEFENWIRNILEQVPEYLELNVSRELKQKGIHYNDSENSGFKFVSRYDEETIDDRYTNFIDLDALIRNIALDIDRLQQMSEDCFLCKYAKEYGSMEPGDERCSRCICNPNIGYERETHPMALKPKNELTDEQDNVKVNVYPSLEAVEWSDRLDDGWFKDKDEYLHEVYQYYRTLGGEFTTTFDNFIIRYTHWVIEETKN